MKGSRRRAAPKKTAQPPQLIAAVDLGSNSFHMIVARVLEGRLSTLDQMREMVQLAAGLSARGQLSRTTQRRALACLARFGQRLQHIPPGGVRAVGTDALRHARNAGDFMAAAEARLGHPIEIIGGQEEARLIYAGVTGSMAGAHEPRLVIDIGGGSTECILGRGREPLQLESLGVGCIGLSRKYFPRGGISALAYQEAEMAARLELQGVAAAFGPMRWARCIGASGTVKAAADLMRTLGLGTAGIQRRGLEQLRSLVLTRRRTKQLRALGLRPERAAVLPGGLAILTAAFDAFNLEEMEVAEGALREGVLYDLWGRLRHEDIREHTIASLAGNYRVDAVHAARVEHTALDLLQQVAPRWELAEREARRRLSWSARLHEIGLAIAHHQYHRHGAYILAHGDLPGFSRTDQQWLSSLVGGHRKRITLSQLDPDLELGDALRLLAVLRLAVLLHRSRSSEPLPPIKLRASGNALSLTVPREWLKDHPLTA
ncbi:MAG TPA: Ppx/GppA phosphatase family protein, partial [Acidiferrobacteraceae bacterium]|nr:Ppx/GppA phosphatase family protein [Acidiferrobacteraceae bacterium]